MVAGLAALIAEGAQAAGRAAMDLPGEHWRHIDRWFYRCSHGMHGNLADTGTADPRFEPYYEKRSGGGAPSPGSSAPSHAGAGPRPRGAPRQGRGRRTRA